MPAGSLSLGGVIPLQGGHGPNPQLPSDPCKAYTGDHVSSPDCSAEHTRSYGEKLCLRQAQALGCESEAI